MLPIHMRIAELTAVLLALAAAFLPLPPTWIDRAFSTGIYPHIQRLLTPLTNVLPFAVLDVLLLAAIVYVVLLLVRGVRQARADRRLLPLARAAGHLAAAAAVVYLAFLGLWGLNYRRVEMAQRLEVAGGLPGPEAVAALGQEAAARMNALHAEAHSRGWTHADWRNDRLRAAFAAVQRALADAPTAEPGRLKATMLGPYFRWTGVDGMINPFGLEVLANPDLLPFERPFVAAHEWAHLAGYADEAEASFVGWLTCLRGDVGAQYSAWLYLYWQVSGEVPTDERERLAQALAAGPRRDVDAIVTRLRRGQWPWLRTAGRAVYDQYLKANRVDEGIRSYGAVVTLILRARFADGWTPIRRAPASSR